MSIIRFLCDEDVPEMLITGLLREEPAIDILAVGEVGAPPKGTPDPQLLLFAEAEMRTMITRDRRTMPKHVVRHLTAGHHTWGVLILRRKASLRRCRDDLILLWAATEAEEWKDQIAGLPYI
jgi:hypothetical protein